MKENNKGQGLMKRGREKRIDEMQESWKGWMKGRREGWDDEMERKGVGMDERKKVDQG